MKLKITLIGTIEDINTPLKDYLALTQSQSDVKQIKQYFGNCDEIADFTGFFLDTRQGDYETESYGYKGGLIPYLNKFLWKIETEEN